VSIKVGQSASLELGYRWLDLNYGSGDGNNEFRYDVLSQGPVVGIGFRF
jgi:opacity protein-like surface antigen